MLPDGVLSTTAFARMFAGYRRNYCSPTRDYEWGGIALNDPSGGLMYQRWRCRIYGDYVILDAEEVQPTAIYVGALLTECSIAFDQNMQPTLAVVEGGRAKLQWYDSGEGKQVVTVLDADVITPRVSQDEKRQSQTAYSDVILAYIRSGGLYYRQQRDRFKIEYLLDAGPHTGINKIGMNVGGRLQFSMAGIAPA